jgi:ferric-dicitrate binding protein FerR (iron transport regulator)
LNIDGSQVKVHGTVFNAKNYPAEKEVVLLEGKVEYINDGKNVFLKPNDRVVENKNSGEMTLDQVDASTYSSWIGGKIYFENESLEDLSLRLERWYDIEFVFEAESIKSYKFTGVINKDKSLDYSLRIIQLTNKVKFRKERDKIIITE